MGVLDMAQSHRRYLENLSLDAVTELTGMWRRVDRNNIRDSWTRQVPRAAAVVGMMQFMAAEASESYTRNILEEQGISPAGRRINPEAFAGSTYPLGGSNGVPLEVAIAAPAYSSLRYIGRGHDVERSMTAGLINLSVKSQTAITDAGRQAEGVTSSTTNTRTVQVRIVQPAACDRCVILAGRLYRDATFLRHPSCHCMAMPTTVEVGQQFITDPYEHFNNLSIEEQNRKFGAKNAQAIRDGADIFQVVNARKDTYNSRGATYYGTSRRAAWGRQQTDIQINRSLRQTRRTRLTPEFIYAQPGGRAQHVRLLEEYGYILPQGQHPSGVIAFAGDHSASINQ